MLAAAATRFYDLPLRLSNSVVPLLSVVVGLLLVFRNGSAYERYSECDLNLCEGFLCG
jgi:putative membrane protein